MLEFARWKYVLVAVVIAAALLFSLPNFFPIDPALQIARKDHAAISQAVRQSVEALLRKQQVPFTRSFIDSGRLIVAFAAVPSELRARDVVNESMASDYISALTNAPRAPAWLRTIGLRPMALGLDLRGGLYLLYQVDVNSAVSQLLDSDEQSFRRALNDAKLPFTDIAPVTAGASTIPNGLRVTLPAGANAPDTLDTLRKDNTDLSFNVTTLGSGAAIDMVLSPVQIRARETYALTKNIETLRNRVNLLDPSGESIVQQQGLDRINVQLPGLTDTADVKDVLGKVATLEFRMVDSQNSAADAEQRGRAPLGSKLYKTTEGLPILLKRELIVSGDQLTNAVTTASQEGPAVSITLDSRGADSMERVSRLNVGKRMAIVYIEKSREQVEVGGQKVSREVTSQKVISYPVIRSALGKTFQVTGLSAVEAQDLALLLRSGSLSASIYPVEERAIGPSLGADNIAKGEMALEIGLVAIFIFMALYYHVFGLVADAVLLANVVLLTALLSIMRTSLSLPGIAGIILTVGIAVDANVLIYERIREEVRNGVSPQAAIRAGFDKAFSAIADSNVTALIAGLALWVVGTGPVRGFAIVLTLGIATSMFTSLLGSRALITLIYGGRRKIPRLSIG